MLQCYKRLSKIAAIQSKQQKKKKKSIGQLQSENKGKCVSGKC